MFSRLAGGILLATNIMNGGVKFNGCLMFSLHWVMLTMLQFWLQVLLWVMLARMRRLKL